MADRVDLEDVVQRVGVDSPPEKNRCHSPPRSFERGRQRDERERESRRQSYDYDDRHRGRSDKDGGRRSNNVRNRDRRSSERHRHSHHSHSHSPSREYRSRRDDRSRSDGVRYDERRRSPAASRDYRKRHEDMPAPADYDRDERTIFISNIHIDADEMDVFDFFDKVGKVRDVKLIQDRNSRRSKGLGYVEFYDVESAQKSLSLHGTIFMKKHLIIQGSQAEKNRSAESGTLSVSAGPCRVYLGDLNRRIREQDVREIFETFGEVLNVSLAKDENGNSYGFGFVTFRVSEDAKSAVAQMVGAIIGGLPLKIGLVNEGIDGASRSVGSFPATGTSSLPAHDGLDDDDGGGGLALSYESKAKLMAKLQGSSVVPQKRAIDDVSAGARDRPVSETTPGSVSAEAFVLRNMFRQDDPEISEVFFEELKEDVLEECEKFGLVKHFYIDRASFDGSVYVRYSQVEEATRAYESLNRRWFGGQLIVCEYQPLHQYLERFPGL